MNGPMRRAGRVPLLATLLLAALPGAMAGQQNRDELIRAAMSAYDQFETARSRELLLAAVNPELGSPDSLWAVGVQLLVQILVETRRDQLATTWMRWAVRTAPDMRVDSVVFLPEVVATYHAARRFVAETGGSGSLIDTGWRWPTPDSRETGGSLMLSAPQSLGEVTIRIDGEERLTPGEPLGLATGSYGIEIEAREEPIVAITREILPGVTTVIDLSPLGDALVLSDSVRASSLRALARLTVTRLDEEADCRAALAVSGEGLFLTTYRAIRGAETLEVVLADGRRVDDVRVAAYAVNDDLAVLHTTGATGPSLELADDADAAGFAWGLGFPGCGAASVTPVRIASRVEGAGGDLMLAAPLGIGDQGVPLIDASGSVLALAAGPDRAIPITRARALLARAESNVAGGRTLTAREVARQQNHLFGSVTISTDLAAAVAEVTPLEPWHWPELAVRDSVPLEFRGPLGRYQLRIFTQSQLQHERQFQIEVGTKSDLFIPLVVVSVTPKKNFPWALTAAGVAGAGAAVALLAGGGGGGDDGSEETTGGIIINIPNP